MCPTDETIRDLTESVCMLAREAGERILEIYLTDYDISEKTDHTPLTTADLEAHQTIQKGLAGLFYQAPVLSEESEAIPYEERHCWETYWLVDPLDGTREFIKRNGEFTVNIALIHRGEPILGVVHAPVLGVCYYAARGQGAWKQVGSTPAERISVRSELADKLVVARSRCPNTGPDMRRFLERLGEHEEVAMGSALKSCLVAEGAADIYARFGPTSEWDTGAAQCIVEEAGGHITDLKLKDLRYNTRESLINPHFFVVGTLAYHWAELVPPGIAHYPV